MENFINKYGQLIVLMTFLSIMMSCSKDEDPGASSSGVVVETEEKITYFQELDTMTFEVSTYYYEAPMGNTIEDILGNPLFHTNATGDGIINDDKKILPDGSIQEASTPATSEDYLNIGSSGFVPIDDFITQLFEYSDPNFSFISALSQQWDIDDRDDLRVGSQIKEGDDIYFAGEMVQEEPDGAPTAVVGKWNSSSSKLEWVLPWYDPSVAPSHNSTVYNNPTYNKYYRSSYFSSLTRDTNGDLLCSGHIRSGYSDDPSDIWVGALFAKVSPSGEVIFSKSFSDGLVAYSENKTTHGVGSQAGDYKPTIKVVSLGKVVPYKDGYLGFTGNNVEHNYSESPRLDRNAGTFVYFSKEGDIVSFLPNWNGRTFWTLAPLNNGKAMYLGDAVPIDLDNDGFFGQTALLKVFE